MRTSFAQRSGRRLVGLVARGRLVPQHALALGRLLRLVTIVVLFIGGVFDRARTASRQDVCEG